MFLPIKNLRHPALEGTSSFFACLFPCFVLGAPENEQKTLTAFLLKVEAEVKTTFRWVDLRLRAALGSAAQRGKTNRCLRLVRYQFFLALA